MKPFERLLLSDDQALAAAIHRAGAGLEADADSRRETLAQRLGLSVAGLVCAVGFNPHAVEITGVAALLGFPGWDALIDERNFLFINDIYSALSIDSIIEIYRVMSAAPAPVRSEFGDVILSRLGHIESQIEATINPVMLSSYKLEIRGIYENHLAVPELVATRLRPEYGPLRGIADEIMALVHAGVVPAAQLLAHAGVSPEEKRRLLFHELVSVADVQARLRAPDISEREREILTEALNPPG